MTSIAEPDQAPPAGTAPGSEHATAHEAAAAPEAPRRPRRRLLIAAVAAATVVVLVAATVTSVVLVQQAEHQDAVELRQEAVAARLAAEADLAAAHEEERVAIDKLTALRDALSPVAALDGDGIDPAARDALAAALAIEAPAPTEVSPGAASPALPDPTTAQLRGEAEAEQAQATAIGARATAIRRGTAEIAAATADLEAALGAYLAAVQTAGAAVLADRADASEETTAALQGLLDALPRTNAADAAARLDEYLASVAAVIASSDEARRPRAPTGGAGGSGYRIPDPGSITAVVNKQRSLSASYAPGDLRRPAGVGNALPLRAEAAAAAERMAADMAAAGISLRMSSGYRSYSRQQTIYNGFVAREGVAGADEHSARPGHSEHQTGLAADFDDGTGCNLNVCFRDRPGGIWLAENAWKYGWILRYGDGWQPIVGYRFEPWHYRYVGVELATAMHHAGTTTLEEWFGLGPAPDYVD